MTMPQRQTAIAETERQQAGAAKPPASRAPVGQTTEQEQRALAYCRNLTRQRAGSFYFGLRLTPEPKRSAMFALYALLRRCDDLADGGPAHDTAAVLQRIDRFSEAVQRLFAGYGPTGGEGPIERDPIWPAVAYLVRRHPVREELIQAMLDGQRRDARGQRYATFDELYRYCYEVASTVGLLCVSIWGHDGQDQTLRTAEHRGIALQLTNIMRDVHEDALAGRIYLPEQELARYAVDEQQLRSGNVHEGFDRLMARTIALARHYYEQGAELEQHIAPECRPTSWAMMHTYRQLLERIAERPRRVLSERVRLGRLSKLTIAGRAIGRSWGTG